MIDFPRILKTDSLCSNIYLPVIYEKSGAPDNRQYHPPGRSVDDPRVDYPDGLSLYQARCLDGRALHHRHDRTRYAGSSLPGFEFRGTSAIVLHTS